MILNDDQREKLAGIIARDMMAAWYVCPVDDVDLVVTHKPAREKFWAMAEAAIRGTERDVVRLGLAKIPDQPIQDQALVDTTAPRPRPKPQVTPRGGLF